MVYAIECGEDDRCTTLYKCVECNCDSLYDWMKFCPSCGITIREFLWRCSERKEKIIDDDIEYEVRCDLETGHTVKHEGNDYMTNRKNTWSD